MATRGDISSFAPVERWTDGRGPAVIVVVGRDEVDRLVLRAKSSTVRDELDGEAGRRVLDLGGDGRSDGRERGVDRIGEIDGGRREGGFRLDDLQKKSSESAPSPSPGALKKVTLRKLI